MLDVQRGQLNFTKGCIIAVIFLCRGLLTVANLA
ncbi:DUF645 family protein [Vibrio cholerae]